MKNNLKKHSVALAVLGAEYHNICGRIFADFYSRSVADDETKKSIEAMDFMVGLMNGDIKKEWKLEESEDYKKMVNIIQSINLLGKDDVK